MYLAHVIRVLKESLLSLYLGSLVCIQGLYDLYIFCGVLEEQGQQ